MLKILLFKKLLLDFHLPTLKLYIYALKCYFLFSCMLQADICMEIFVTDVRWAPSAVFSLLSAGQAVISALFIKTIQHSFAH